MQSGASPPFARMLGSHVETLTLIKSIMFRYAERIVQSSLHTNTVRISQVRIHIPCLTDTLNAGSHVGNTPRQMKGKATSKHFLFGLKVDVNMLWNKVAVLSLSLISSGYGLSTASFTG